MMPGQDNSSDPVADASSPALHPRYRAIHSDYPAVELLWTSLFPSRPDKLKIRKHFTLFPIKFTLKADYDTRNRTFEYGASAKDIILGGRITVNVPERKVEYRKAFRLPGQNGTLAVYGNCGYRDRRLDPNVAVQLEFGADSGYDSSLPDSHTDAVWLGNTWGVRQQVSLGKGIGFEVCGGITMPTPSASYSYGSGMLAIGEGAIRLHVAEVNAVLNIE